jgi:outer membrane cobalamin receptor
MLNGRTLNDPLSGTFNAYHAQPEDYQRIEIVTGPRSFLYGLNTAGAAVNFVARDYSSNKPYSSILYAEGPDGLGRSDGTFSQNITRRANISAGFQHLGTDGRYPNSFHDQWGVRGKLRYFLAEHLALILSENFLSTQTDLNGGIAPGAAATAFAFQPLRAAVVNTDSHEKLRRHDLDLSLVGALSQDSTIVSRLTLYYSNLLREYRDEESGSSPNGTVIRSDHRTSWLGVRFAQSLSFPAVEVNGGATAEKVNVGSSPNIDPRSEFHPAVWVKAEARVVRPLRLTAFGRIERLFGNTGMGVGADAAMEISPIASLLGGISVSDRLPNMFELFWSDSTIYRSNRPGPEHHTQAEAGAEIRFSPGVAFRGTIFHRILEKPILLMPFQPGRFAFPGISISSGDRIITFGFEAGGTATIWYLLLDAAVTYNHQEDGSGNRLSRFPVWNASGGIFLRGKFFSEHLDLKAGFRGKFISSFQGDRFNAEALAYVANEGDGVQSSSTADFVLAARIGDANIHLVWENLTNSNFFSAPYFVAPDRGVRFGILWEFQN